jgi:hypothetical protein
VPEASDGNAVGERAANAPHNTLKAKIKGARKTAPPGADLPAIFSVAWKAWESDRDPAEVWAEDGQR